MKGLACLKKEELITGCTESTKGLVLRSKNPYGSYYSEHPEVQKILEVLYIAVKSFNECMETKIIRLNQELKKDDSDLKLNYAHLTLYNKVVPVVVIHVSDILERDKIIEYLEQTDIKVLKKQNVKPYVSIVQIRKFVDLQKIQPDVYKSHEKFHYYLSVPKNLEWEDFRECVDKCRNSHNFPHFDAAQLSLFQYDSIQEFVRIYSQTATENDLINMRDELIKRYKNYI